MLGQEAEEFLPDRRQCVGVRTSAHRRQPIDPRNESEGMNLEETLEKVVELAREELQIVRKRAEEKTPARDHGKDYHAAENAADRLDH